MRISTIRGMFLATALAGLTACGGGGGGGGSGLVTVPPPAPPPPPPTLGMPVNIFPSITTSTEFATLGYEVSSSAAPTQDGFAVRYDAASNAYIFDLPSHAPGEFRTTSGDDKYWSGGLPAGSILWPPMGVLKPGASNPLIQLDHTSFAYYLSAGPMEDLPHGVVAFGTATAAGAVPTTGSATMNAIVSGIAPDRYGGTIGGTATFNFDFGAGTLAGQFNPVLTEYYGSAVPLGTYTFNNTVFGVGSPAFSGSMTHGDPGLTGAFNGVFTGPNAQEMMARWTATYFIAGVTPNPEQMFGVMVGKRCC